MIKLEQTEQMTQIAKRTKHVRVRVLDLRTKSFLAQSSKDPDRWYKVELKIAPDGTRLGRCSCEAGQFSIGCRHLCAVVGYLRGVEAARRGAERQCARSEASRVSQADLDAAPLLKSAPEGPKEGCTNV